MGAVVLLAQSGVTHAQDSDRDRAINFGDVGNRLPDGWTRGREVSRGVVVAPTKDSTIFNVAIVLGKATAETKEADSTHGAMPFLHEVMAKRPEIQISFEELSGNRAAAVHDVVELSGSGYQRCRVYTVAIPGASGGFYVIIAAACQRLTTWEEQFRPDLIAQADAFVFGFNNIE